MKHKPCNDGKCLYVRWAACITWQDFPLDKPRKSSFKRND